MASGRVRNASGDSRRVVEVLPQGGRRPQLPTRALVVPLELRGTWGRVNLPDVTNKIAFMRWLAKLEDPEAEPHRAGALRSGAELSSLAIAEHAVPDGDAGRSDVIHLLGELRSDRWINWNWQRWPQDHFDGAPPVLTLDDLGRIETIRITPDGYMALLAQSSARPNPSDQHERPAGGPTHDCFICHASADKDAVAGPLAEELRRRGYDVWYDEFELQVGDSLHERIEAGLAGCRAGVVILSEAFFEADWPQQELNGLVARETSGGERLILPIWHAIDAAFLLERAPILADRFALDSSEGSAAIAERIGRVLNRRRGAQAIAERQGWGVG